MRVRKKPYLFWAAILAPSQPASRANPAVGRLSRVNPAVSRLSRVNPAMSRLSRVNPAVSRLPCTPHYVVVQIKCWGSVPGGRIPGPAACFRGIRRRTAGEERKGQRSVRRNFKSPSGGEDGARNGVGNL